MTIDSTPATRVARATLDNGLGVIVVSDHSTPVAGIHLTYRVGSRDERPGMTGFAHLFEHLMFQGSANVAAGEYVECMGEVGGSPNAATYFDWTAYHVEVPVGALELALWMEADRMAGLPSVLSQIVLDTEKEIVKNERRESDKQPYADAWELLHAALFGAEHPYGWMPIGSIADVDAATLEQVSDFFATRYGPNNCVLAICGDVTGEQGITLAQRYFGGIPRNDRVPARTETAIERLRTAGHIMAPKPGPLPASISGYRGPAEADPSRLALNVGLSILGDGPASRLYEQLVRGSHIAHSVETGLTPLHGGTCVPLVMAYLADGADPTAYERVRDEQIALLARSGPSEAELSRARAQLERALWEATESAAGLAELYSEAEAFRPGYDPVVDYLAELGAVTSEDVRAAVATWLDPGNRVIVSYAGGGEENFEDWDMDPVEDEEIQ